MLELTRKTLFKGKYDYKVSLRKQNTILKHNSTTYFSKHRFSKRTVLFTLSSFTICWRIRKWLLPNSPRHVECLRDFESKGCEVPFISDYGTALCCEEARTGSAFVAQQSLTYCANFSWNI
jgi:hypothetical protein